MLATTDTQLRDVTRTVEQDGPGFAVILAQAFDAPPAEVWAALTEPARILRYFGEVTGELREGGEFRIPMMGVHGPVLTVQERELLRIAWGFEAHASSVELRIGPSADGTGSLFTLRHHVPADKHWDTYGPAATGCGWDGALLGLARHLQQPATSWTQEMAGFETSSEGREFVTATCELWQQAHLAAGADPHQAHEAAARTAAFYRGEGPNGGDTA